MTIRKENIHAVLTDLATRYPRAFALEKYRPHRPLKVGVAADTDGVFIAEEPRCE